MSEKRKLEDESLVTREELREVGLNYTSTSFQRWEKAKKLTPVKPGGSPSSRVHYKWGEVKIFLSGRSPT
jgi:hypothetical protein